MLFSSIAFAQDAAPGPSAFEQWMPLIFVFVIFYFLIIRPQQKRAKTHQNFVANLKRGDSVLTSSGILGTIEGLTEQYVTLEIAEGVRVRILKSAIASSATGNEEKK